ncbi:protein tramtrack, beta isoform-like isoform X1 [Tigriopus californicus]|uniref:protein tramtrack, beta isoform-like isoform X1 n=1 Tax=Tigriopus californicus TaxID=6832 RepID=UPI0027D9EA32|nr:protein tramtrack, beta isoform-like isoform X1 [Tigriopus californicus]XP_059090106.1 protein tramtrack, beta isoform-like isoform X1 [Tigriopus californicus]XP_059090107.1 protein tramtrack, beta isoform-like isoform X1 [Tigriopus californicus]XP_059090108.1 protein tramtrack, beta isoform-like isoform X1 [Tigriopus californicus]XP_059090110.1 protein tramtrack, beta isoform-like isoform X1 [Tigriopus californicus]|eukprot:TCALIF_06245-PB protein Name:"Similar to lolal Longitudinals lacking protein-like (Drosophila melanogaster)" AED:0.27 eAED:0.27 QI:1606/1/1/1/0.5/0.6/5/150/360
MGSDNFCLKWNDFESNISSSFKEIRRESEFFDVTLSCDQGNEQVHAHKVILAACSPFFRRVLNKNPHQNPVIYLKGVDFHNLNAILNFMYYGEVNVGQDELNGFLKVAQELSVKGLTDGPKKSAKEGSPQGDSTKTKSLLKKTLQQQPQKNKSNSTPAGPPLPPLSTPPALKKRKLESPIEKATPPIEVKPDVETLKRMNAMNNSEDDNDGDDFGGEDGDPAVELEEYGYAQYGDDSNFGADESNDNIEMSQKMEVMGEDGSKGIGSTVADYVMRNAQGTYWCKGCGHHSSSRRDLQRHIEARHISGDYQCKYCEKSLTTKYNLQRHINKNHKEESLRDKQMISWPDQPLKMDNMESPLN